MRYETCVTERRSRSGQKSYLDVCPCIRLVQSQASQQPVSGQSTISPSASYFLRHPIPFCPLITLSLLITVATHKLLSHSFLSHSLAFGLAFGCICLPIISFHFAGWMMGRHNMMLKYMKLSLFLLLHVLQAARGDYDWWLPFVFVIALLYIP